MQANLIARASLLTLLAVTFGYGQLAIRANIPFQFTAQGKVLPAGSYDIVREPAKELIRFSGAAKGASVFVPIVTRLAKGVHTVENAHIVFDKVGDTHFLSELWIPGQDGYLLHSTKAKHEHEVVDVPR